MAKFILIFKYAARRVTAVRPSPSDSMIQPRFDEAERHLPVLTPDGYAAMLLRVNAFAAVSEQLRRDFASGERLGGGGGGRATGIREKTNGIFWSIASTRWRRPVESQRKPGAGFEMSQGCAGESAGAAELARSL